MKTGYRRRAKKTTAFNPSHQDLEQAIMEFQQKGGTIKKVEAKDTDFGKYVSKRDERAVDEFLMTELNL